MAISKVRFKVDDLESMVEVEEIDELSSNDFGSGSGDGGGGGSGGSLEEQKEVTSEESQAELNQILDDIIFEGMTAIETPAGVLAMADSNFQLGEALKQFTGIDLATADKTFFPGLFNQDSWLDNLTEMANTLSGSLGVLATCLLSGMIPRFGLGGFGLGNLFNLNALLNRCMQQAVRNAVGTDLNSLVNKGLAGGYYGIVNKVSNTVNDAAMLAPIAAGALTTSVLKGDSAGMFDVMSSRVAGSIKNVSPGIADVVKTSLKLPAGIKPHQYPDYGKMLFNGMDRIDAQWATRPPVKASSDFNLVMASVGREQGRSAPLSVHNAAYIANTGGLRSRNSSVSGILGHRPSSKINVPFGPRV